MALMPAGALAVHQLRYWLAFGNRAGVELERQGHSYLHSLVPWIVLALALAVGAFLRALGGALGSERSLPRRALSFSALWALCAGCLVAIFTTQEFLEGLLASGHPAGLAGIFGYGGWWAIPAALAVGFLLAAILHGAHRVLEAVALRRAGRARPALGGIACAAAPRARFAPRPAPLADGWSGRGPPRRSSAA